LIEASIIQYSIRKGVSIMKTLRFLAIALVMSLATPAFAQVIRGEISSLSPETGYVIVKTEVMGLAGPEKKDVAFKIDEETILNLCWGETCDGGNAVKGLSRLKDFDHFTAENLSVIGKEVEMHYSMERPETIEMINIYAPVPSYYFNPVDFMSVF
jgi:hypothetical protein